MIHLFLLATSPVPILTFNQSCIHKNNTKTHLLNVSCNFNLVHQQMVHHIIWLLQFSTWPVGVSLSPAFYPVHLLSQNDIRLSPIGLIDGQWPCGLSAIHTRPHQPMLTSSQEYIHIITNNERTLDNLPITYLP